MDIDVKYKGGALFTKLKPLFSSDEKNIYVACNNCILKYSTRTGNLITEYSGSKEPIIGFNVQNFNSCESVIACSTQGEVIVWKTVTNFKIYIKRIQCTNIQHFYMLPSETDNHNNAIIAYNQNGSLICGMADLEKGTIRNYSLKNVAQWQYCIAVNSNKYFAISSKNNIYFVNINNFQEFSCGSLSGKVTITCLACHPEDPVVVTGDNSGKVIVWQNIFSNSPTQAVFHWHTLPVQCVSFSSVGSYFYSGGKESVLVRWDFHNHLNRKFLPRLPSDILQIGVSGDNQYLAVSTGDNAVKVIDSRFDEVCSIQNLVVGNQYECGILLDPRTKTLVMNGNIGQIQFYSPSDMNLLYNIDIIGKNKLTNERDCNIENTRITKMAISKNGLWLATVEERKDIEYFHEINLKFWHFNTVQQMFELNTSIENPHEQSINSILFQTTSEENVVRCVTIGEDRKFKVWQLTEIVKLNVKTLVWRCISEGFYRNLPCHGLTFSIDGSLMAIGFGPIVTTWLPDTCELKCSLVYPGHRQHVKHLQFGTNDRCHLIVAATQNQLTVWNLLTLCMMWTVPVGVQFLLADISSIFVAAITNDKKLFIFSPDCPDPVYSNEEILKEHNILAASLIPNQDRSDAGSSWYARSQIYFINSHKKLYCLGIGEDYFPGKVEDEFAGSLYNKMMPTKKISTVKKLEQKQQLFAKDTAHSSIKKYLEAPLQTMVPIHLICDSLIKSLVIQKTIR